MDSFQRMKPGQIAMQASLCTQEEAIETHREIADAIAAHDADLATGNYITGGMTVIITGPA